MTSSPLPLTATQDEASSIAERIAQLEASMLPIRREIDRLKHLASLIPANIYIMDFKQLNAVYSNRALSALFDYTAEELRRMGTALVPTLVHPDDLPRYSLHLERLTQIEDGEVLKLDYRIRLRSGDYRWLRTFEQVFSRNPDRS